MKVKMKKTLSFLIMFNVMISSTSIGVSRLVHAQDTNTNSSVSTSSEVDGVTSATIKNVETAIKNLKIKVDEAEKIYKNAVQGTNTGEYPKEAKEMLKKEIDNTKSNLNSTDLTQLGSVYKTLDDAIRKFEFSVIKEEFSNSKDDDTSNTEEPEKSTNTTEDNNKQEVNVNAAVVGMYDEIICEPNNIVSKGDSVEDILKANNIKYELNEEGTIKSVNDVANGTKTDDGFYDDGSKWICSVNNKKIEGSIKDTKITKSDYIVFCYSNDDKIPCYDENKNDFIKINVKVFDVEGNEIANEKVTTIKGVNEYFLAKNAFKKSGKDIYKYYPETNYIKGEHEVRVIINEDAKTVTKIFSPINEGDEVVIYESGYDYCSEAPYFSKIEVSSKEVKKGEKVDISVFKVDVDWDAEEDYDVYTYNPAGKERVYFGDKTYVTDDKGKVSIPCDTVGEFEVYAKYDKMFHEEDDYYDNFILPSNKIKIVVKGEDDDITTGDDIKKSDKKELLKLIDEAKTLYQGAKEGETEGKYKKESKDKLLEAVNVALNISLDESVIQEKIDEEVEKLKASIKEFKESVVKIDSSKLKTLIDEALNLYNNSSVGSGLGQYKAEDKEEFKNEVNKIGKIFKSKNKTQKDVDEASVKLESLIENFKKAAIDITKNFKIEAIDLPKEFIKGTSAKLSSKAINETKENKQICLITGIFDDNNKLIKYSAIKQVVKSGGNIILTTNTNLPNENGIKVKAFVWDNLESMTPYSNGLEFNVK